MANEDYIGLDILIDDKKADITLKNFEKKLEDADKRMSARPPIQLPGITGSSDGIRRGRDLDLAPKIKALRDEANGATSALKLTNHQMTNLSYQVNDIATMLAMGASPFQIISSQAGQIIQTFDSVDQAIAFTQAGLAKIGLSMSGLIGIGGVAIVGATAIALATEYYDLAQRELITQERISGEKNKQVAALQRANAEYDRRIERSREQLALEEKISKLINTRATTVDNLNLGGQTQSASELTSIRQNAERQVRERLEEINRLEAGIEVSERLLAGNKERGSSRLAPLGVGRSQAEAERSIQRDTAALERQQKALELARTELSINEATVQQVDKAFKSLSNNADKAFSERWEAIKRNNEDALKFVESVNKGIERARESSKAYKLVFENLTVQTHSENPFVKIAVDGDKAFRELRENIRGLPEDLQRSALATQNAINMRQLFQARVENAMGVFDLRDLADRFMDDTGTRRNLAQKDLEREKKLYEEMSKAGLVNNPQEWNERIRRRETEAAMLVPAAERARALAEVNLNSDRREFERLRAMGAGINEEAWLRDMSDRQGIIDRMTSSDVQARLDRQLEDLNKLDPQNEGERAIIDQRIIGLLRSGDPSQFNANQRAAGADAALREAERSERFRQRQIDIAAETLEVNKSIDLNQKRLVGIAEKQGITGVENAIDIRIKDDTGRAMVETRGNASDTATRYGSFTGGGGLTNY